MTAKIELESLPCAPEAFAEAVDGYAKAMTEYAAHLVGVEQDALNEALKPEERRVAFPPPSAHPLVEAAVKAGGYELFGPSLKVRKERFAADVRQREGSLIEGVLPAAKRRHWQFREQDIRAADQMRVGNHPTRIEPDQVGAFLRSARPSDDTAFLEEMKERHESVAAIQRWAAKNEHDIDDLTDATVDGWKLTPFHG